MAVRNGGIKLMIDRSLRYGLVPLASLTFIIGSFASIQWITYNDDQHRGLWQKCTTSNKTDSEGSRLLECAQLAMAEGPVFLELTRTLMCLTLALYVLACIGICLDRHGVEPKETCKMQFKFKFQELSYFIVGIFGVSGNIIYGLNYYDYHANEIGLRDLKLGSGFHISCWTTGLTLIFSSVLIGLHDTSLLRTIKKQMLCCKLDKTNANLKPKPKPKPKKAANSAQDDRNKEEENIDSQKKDEVKKTEVSIKTRKLARWFVPFTLIQSLRRLKPGLSHNDKVHLVENERHEANNKRQKGIVSKEFHNSPGKFAINVDHSKEETASENERSPSKQTSIRCDVTTLADIEAPDETGFSWADKAGAKGQSNLEDMIVTVTKSSDDVIHDSFKYQRFGIPKTSAKQSRKAADVCQESGIEETGQPDAHSLTDSCEKPSVNTMSTASLNHIK